MYENENENENGVESSAVAQQSQPPKVEIFHRKDVRKQLSRLATD